MSFADDADVVIGRTDLSPATLLGGDDMLRDSESRGGNVPWLERRMMVKEHDHFLCRLTVLFPVERGRSLHSE